MTTTINFTKEHLAKLKDLAFKFLFNGQLFRGSGVGITNSTVYDLIHNLSIKTLITILGSIKNQIKSKESLDTWSMNEYQQQGLALLKKQEDFVDLLIGYRKHQELTNKNKKLVAELQEKRQQIANSAMTPTEQLAALDAQIASYATVEIEEIISPLEEAGNTEIIPPIQD